MEGMIFHVAAIMKTPTVWHGARLHLRLLVNLVYDVGDTGPHKTL